MKETVIYWFRNDLRLTDLPALAAAGAGGRQILPCFVLDDDAAGDWAPGGASRWWLHHSLRQLDTSLRELGSELLVLRGATAHTLIELAAQVDAGLVYCSEAYEPWARLQQRRVHDTLWAAGIEVHMEPGALLHHPEAVRTGAGEPYKVFTPFWRACRQQPEPAACLPAPKAKAFAAVEISGLPESQWDLLPTRPNWAVGWEAIWQPGETGAAQALQNFIARALDDYSEGRDFPAANKTSRLSPHLHFGEISPRQVWHAIRQDGNADPKAAEKFLAEVGWREFCYQLLYHNPEIPEKPFKDTFGEMPWLADEQHLKAWQRGQTGYPIVDAGMRELWQTGFMHNRVRMIVASFLTKHLLLPWQWGERWFWDTLVDADLANNSCGWQWVAGCGADAAPYFRIFNPVLQGKKFDPEGEYVRHWVPEIAGLPDRYLHAPWEAPPSLLEETEITLGDDYPSPIVDHKTARESALEAYRIVKGA